MSRLLRTIHHQERQRRTDRSGDRGRQGSWHVMQADIANSFTSKKDLLVCVVE